MSCNAKKDPNGTWRIQYRWTDWTGTKKKSQKRGFKTKKEAEEWYAHFMLQQSSDPTMTLADFYICVMKRMKADKSLGYNYDTDRFESDSRKEDDIFLNLEMLCENKIETSDRSEGAISRNDRIKAMENMVHSLISD